MELTCKDLMVNDWIMFNINKLSEKHPVQLKKKSIIRYKLALWMILLSLFS